MRTLVEVAESGQPTMTSSHCMMAFRANRISMSPQKFLGNVESGEYSFVHMSSHTKKRTATIYIKDFIDYMHSKGVQCVLPFEPYKEDL